MEALIIVLIVAALLFNFGVVVGAGIQDRIWEDRRRRLAQRRREVNAKVRELREHRQHVSQRQRHP